MPRYAPSKPPARHEKQPAKMPEAAKQKPRPVAENRAAEKPTKPEKFDSNDIVVKLGQAALIKFVEDAKHDENAISCQSKRLDRAQLRKQYPNLREPVIDGILRRGEIINVVAPPKKGKSFLVHGLAMSLCSGGAWLDQFNCHQGRVLIVDNELHRETLNYRLDVVQNSFNLDDAYLSPRLEVLPLRGELQSIRDIPKFLGNVRPGEFALIVFDAFYKFLPARCDENDNGQIAEIYSLLDQSASKLDCALALIHHSSKGSQSGKSVTDVGSGAGVMSRAADSHLVLRNYTDENGKEVPGKSNWAVMDVAVRSFTSVYASVCEFRYPRWYHLAGEHAPGREKFTRGHSGEETKKPKDEAAAILEIIRGSEKELDRNELCSELLKRNNSLLNINQMCQELNALIAAKSIERVFSGPDKKTVTYKRL